MSRRSWTAMSWLQSVLFLLWHLALVTPAWIFMVKVYEERELEIRFGEPYRRYRAATPFLWPVMRPRRSRIHVA